MDEITNLSRELAVKSAAVRRVKVAVNVALLGAGAGALVGGGLGAATAMRRKDKRKNWLSSAAHGALLGAGTGAGAGALAATVAKLPSAGPTGLTMPKSINAPAIAKELDKAQPSMLDQLKGTVAAPFNAIGSYAQNHPILSLLAGADATSHGIGTAANAARNMARVPSANPDDFLKGLDRLAAEGGKDNNWAKLKSTLGISRDKVQELLLKARQSNLNTQGLAETAAEAAAAAETASAKAPTSLDAMVELLEAGKSGPFGTSSGEALQKAKATRDAAGAASSIADNLLDTQKIPGAGKLTAQDVFDIGRKGQDSIQPGGYRDLVDLWRIATGTRAAGVGMNAHNARITGGTPGDFGRAVNSTGTLVSNLPQEASEGPRLGQLLAWLRSPQSKRLQTDFLTGAPRASTLARGILPRLALYGGVPLAQMAAGNAFKQMAEQRRLDQLLGKG